MFGLIIGLSKGDEELRVTFPKEAGEITPEMMVKYLPDVGAGSTLDRKWS
jgi:hypothetical protein